MDATVAASLQRRGITCVYHFVGLEYLPNVLRRGGLCCASMLRGFGDSFDDDPQKWGSHQKGVDFAGYISLSVNPPMGMMTRNKLPVIIELSSDVAAADGTLFIGKWSSFADVTFAAAVQQIGGEWFDRMFLTATATRANPHPGEFLVPQMVPLSSLRRMVFYTQEDYEAAREMLANVPRPDGITAIRAGIEPYLFGRKMQEA